MYILASFLAVGFICNALVRPVADKWLMKETHEAPARGKPIPGSSRAAAARSSVVAAVAWTLVSVPIAWGVWKALESAVRFFK